MRIAVLILALCLSIPLGIQSAAVATGAAALNNQVLSQAASIGILDAILFLLGAAFVMGAPRAAQVIFLMASIFAVLAASLGSAFADLNVWAGVAFILSCLSYLGVRERRTLR